MHDSIPDAEIPRWRATALAGSRGHGINKSTTETFSAKGLEALVREVIQNSLDACNDESKPVKVVFSRFEVNSNDLPGAKEYFEILKMCHTQAVKEKDQKAIGFFSTAIFRLTSGKLSVLRISDFNTTGLLGADKPDSDMDTPWSGLIKSEGSSRGKKAGAAGSFGIGKGAPFACSELRTIFYSSQDTKGVKSTIGDAQFISYRDNALQDSTTGELYYSIHDRKHPIMELLPLDPNFQRKSPGTDVYVYGFSNETQTKNWERTALLHVLQNFLVSIYRGQLSVCVGQSGFVDSTTLEPTLDRLEQEGNDVKLPHLWHSMLSDNGVRVSRYSLDDASYCSQHGFTKDDCELLLMRDEKATGTVMYSRGAGMTIFTDNPVPYASGFAGLLMITGEKMSSEFLKMEGASHNSWKYTEPQLAEEKTRAKAQLYGLEHYVEETIKAFLGLNDMTEVDAFGMDQILPEVESIEAVVKKRPNSKSELKGAKVTKRKKNKRKSAQIPGETTVSPGGEDSPPGVGPRGSAAHKPRGSGQRPTIEDPNGKKAWHLVPSEAFDFRLMAVHGNSPGSFRLLFTVPNDKAECKLRIRLAGETGDGGYPQIHAVHTEQGSLETALESDGDLMVRNLSKGNHVQLRIDMDFNRPFAVKEVELYEAR